MTSKTVSRPDAFGPWASGLSDAERLARLRSLRALVQVFYGPNHCLVQALAQAETDPTDAAAQAAWDALMTMPSLRRRRILASLPTLLRTPGKVERMRGKG